MSLSETATPSGRAMAVAIIGGCLYASGVLVWALTTGIRVSAGSIEGTLFNLGFAAVGLFLLAATPLYLLGRYSLIVPFLVAVLSLGNVVYLRWYVPRPHDALASYLVIWPIFVTFIGIAAVIEAGIRIGTDHVFDRFELRPLW